MVVEPEAPLRVQVLDKIAALITISFGLIAALAWNEAIKALIARYLAPGAGLAAAFGYAAVVTIIAVIASIWIARSLAKARSLHAARLTKRSS